MKGLKYVPIALILIGLGLTSNADCKPRQKDLKLDSGVEQIIKEESNKEKHYKGILESLDIRGLTPEDLFYWIDFYTSSGIGPLGESFKISIHPFEDWMYVFIKNCETNYAMEIRDFGNDEKADQVILNGKIFERKKGTYNYMGTEEQMMGLSEQIYKNMEKGFTFTEEQIKDMLERYIEQQNTKSPYTKEPLETLFQDADQKLKVINQVIKQKKKIRQELIEKEKMHQKKY